MNTILVNIKIKNQKICERKGTLETIYCARFLSFNNRSSLDWLFLVWRGSLVHNREFTSTPSLYPLNAKCSLYPSTSPWPPLPPISAVTIKNFSVLQVLPGGWGVVVVQNHPQLRTTDLVQTLHGKMLMLY